MTHTSRHLSYAFALAAALHAVVFVLVAWCLVVGLLRGLDLSAFNAPEPLPEEEMMLLLEPEPAKFSLQTIDSRLVNLHEPTEEEPAMFGKTAAVFESDRALRGASEAAPDAQADKNLPSVKGAQLKFRGFKDQPAGALADIVRQAAQQRQEAALTGDAAPQAAAQTPQPSTPAETGPASIKTAQRGGISARGAASVAATTGPLAKYKNQVMDVIQAKFDQAIKRGHTPLERGFFVTVEFDINPRGGVENLRILNPSKDTPYDQQLLVELLTNAQLLPIPDDLRDSLIEHRLPFSAHDYFF